MSVEEYAIVGMAAILSILVALAVLFDWRRIRGSQEPSYEAAVAAIDKIKEWGIWMAGISTGAIAAVGALLPKTGWIDGCYRFAAILAVMLFGASILVSTWLMATLPSLHLRLRKVESRENDIYEQKIFWLVNVRVGLLAALQHLFFMMAIVAFAFFIYRTILAAGRPPQ
jgi:hypothetical protein